MRSIRAQLTFSLLIAFTLLFGLVGFLIERVVAAALIAEFDRSSLTRAWSLAAITEYEDGRLELDFEKDEQDARFDPSSEFFQFFGPTGISLLKSPALREGTLSPMSLTERGGEAAFFEAQLPGGKSGRAVQLHFRPEKSREPIWLVLGRSDSSLSATLGTVRAVLGLGGVVLVGLTVPLVGFVVSHITRPLRLLAQHAANMDADSLDRRFPCKNLPVELASIVDRLNQLLSRLALSFERERRFGADVAHELRTPLAELRTTAEVALRWPEGQDQKEVLRNMLEATCAMQSLVCDLLVLKRSEEDGSPSRLESVSPALVFEELIRSQAEKIEKKYLKVESSHETGLWVLTDVASLKLVLGNLMQNAVEYSPEGGILKTRTFQKEKAGPIFLEIKNAAPNLEEKDLDHLTERFWRKEPSRHDRSHSGLGLSIASSIAARIGCTLCFDLDEGVLTASLKCAPKPE
jgi:signal transduction histidine kinase